MPRKPFTARLTHLSFHSNFSFHSNLFIFTRLITNLPSPSGTEDVVRVYAETQNVQDTENLAYEVIELVFDRGGGIGDRPKDPALW